MPRVTRADYMDNLWRIQSAYELKYPEASDIQSVCPHLTDMQIARLMASEQEEYVALPPVLVKGAFHVGHYRPFNRRFNLPPVFRILPESGRESRLHRSYLYLGQARSYANRNWPHSLISEDWVAAQTVYLLRANADPQPMIADDRTSHSALIASSIIWVGLKPRATAQPYSDMEDNLEDWNDLVAHYTFNRIEGLEIEGDHGSIRAFNCIVCGGLLSSKGCQTYQCPNKTADSSVTIGNGYWRTPLPQKLLLALGIKLAAA